MANKNRIKRESLAPIPENLQILLNTQEKDGRWLPIDRVINALGGKKIYPDPPEGIRFVDFRINIRSSPSCISLSSLVRAILSCSDWRWCTTLVLIFLRRHPLYYDRINEAHDLAFKWTDDDKLTEMARSALPPGKQIYLKSRLRTCLNLHIVFSLSLSLSGFATQSCSYADSLDGEMVYP